MDYIKMKNGTSLVRVFNASPQSPPVDVYINGKIIFSNLEYKEFSNYVILAKGAYRIDIFPAGTSEKPAISGSIDLEEGQILTIAAIGNLDNLELLVINDHSDKKVSSDKSAFRVVHLSPNAPAVDILVNDKILVTDLKYKQNTSYVDAQPGKYNIDVVLTEEHMAVLSFSATLKADRIYTIYIVGDVPNIEAIQSVDGNTYLID